MRYGSGTPNLVNVENIEISNLSLVFDLENRFGLVKLQRRKAFPFCSSFMLSKIAKTHPTKSVRKQAIYRLEQMGDQCAVRALEKLVLEWES